MSEQRLPLIFALKHFHILAPSQPLGALAEFSRSARLMQGDREIPSANEVCVDAFLKTTVPHSLPVDFELEMLQMSCPGWPEETVYAFAGITAFGANGIERAKACAQHALRLNRDCRLARQLIRLLATKTDVRCPYGVDAAKAPDVTAILTDEG